MSLSWQKCKDGHRARVKRGQFRTRLLPNGKHRASYETVRDGYVVGVTFSEDSKNGIQARDVCEENYKRIKAKVDE